MSGPRRRVLALALAVVLAGAAAACGGEPEPGGGDAAEAGGRPDTSAAGTPEGTRQAPEGEGGEAVEEDSAEDSGRGDTLAAPADSGGAAAADRRPLRARLLRLVNSLEEDVVVHAAAGAGWVTLDTVPAGDSSEVNVESRAPRVSLRALGSGGRTVATDSVDLTGPGTARWRIPAGAPSSPGAGEAGPVPDQPPNRPVKNPQVSTSRS